MSLLTSLTQKGWNQETTIPFREVVAQEATECYTYTNQKNSQVAILNVPSKSLIRVRLSGTRGNNFNYFEIKINSNEEVVIHTIDLAKDEADINNYFSFYFSLQEGGEVSILAWEQWEKDYR
jgi:hypothetical protein